MQKLRALALILPLLSLGIGTHARAQAVAVIVSNCSVVSGMMPATEQPLYEDAKGRLCGLAGTGTGGSQTTTPDSAVSTGYQQLTSLSTATSFTPPALTTFCLVIAEAQALRFRADGVAPTATVGQTMAVGQPFIFRMPLASLSALQFIQQTAGGIANVSCFKDS